MTAEELRPLVSFLPGRSRRWIADACRAGKFPGAIIIGKVWSILPSDWARFVASKKTPGIPTEEEAAADLRRRGVLV